MTLHHQTFLAAAAIIFGENGAVGAPAVDHFQRRSSNRRERRETLMGKRSNGNIVAITLRAAARYLAGEPDEK